MSFLKKVVFSICLSFLLFPALSSAACICEEDASKIAMSHYIKNFSALNANPNVKVRVEKVESVKINGYNGTVELYHVMLSKYHKETLLKITDFLNYEIEKQNAAIIAFQNVECVDDTLKSKLMSVFGNEGISSQKFIDYEKYANIIILYGNVIIDGMKDRSETNVEKNNIETILSGIELYRPELKPMISSFEKGLKSICLTQKIQ